MPSTLFPMNRFQNRKSVLFCLNSTGSRESVKTQPRFGLKRLTTFFQQQQQQPPPPPTTHAIAAVAASCSAPSLRLRRFYRQMRFRRLRTLPLSSPHTTHYTLTNTCPITSPKQSPVHCLPPASSTFARKHTLAMSTKCTVEGCGKWSFQGGLCRGHMIAPQAAAAAAAAAPSTKPPAPSPPPPQLLLRT